MQKSILHYLKEDYLERSRKRVKKVWSQLGNDFKEYYTQYADSAFANVDKVVDIIEARQDYLVRTYNLDLIQESKHLIPNFLGGSTADFNKTLDSLRLVEKMNIGLRVDSFTLTTPSRRDWHRSNINQTLKNTQNALLEPGLFFKDVNITRQTELKNTPPLFPKNTFTFDRLLLYKKICEHIFDQNVVPDWLSDLEPCLELADFFDRPDTLDDLTDALQNKHCNIGKLKRLRKLRNFSQDIILIANPPGCKTLERVRERVLDVSEEEGWSYDEEKFYREYPIEEVMICRPEKRPQFHEDTRLLNATWKIGTYDQKNSEQLRLRQQEIKNIETRINALSSFANSTVIPDNKNIRRAIAYIEKITRTRCYTSHQQNLYLLSSKAEYIGLEDEVRNDLSRMAKETKEKNRAREIIPPLEARLQQTQNSISEYKAPSEVTIKKPIFYPRR